MLRWKYSRPFLAVIVLLLALSPVINFGPLKGAGMQQTFAVAFIWGALALSYDLLFGFTGLLSFGHALFFASGAYITTILIITITFHFIWLPSSRLQQRLVSHSSLDSPHFVPLALPLPW